MAMGDYDNDGDIDLFGAQAWGYPPAEVWRNDTRTGTAQPSRVLVFSKTAGFRHESIPDCIAAIKSLGAMNNFLVDATEDASVFTPSDLSQYSAVVFCLTTGDVLNDEQQAAFEGFIQSSKGWVGLHSACDTEYDSSWYGKLVGAYFKAECCSGTLNLTTVDFDHSSTATMPANWTNQSDGAYNQFSNDPTDNGATILVTVDLGGGQTHPYSWYHDYDGGRAWYTAGGGDANAFKEALFLKHLEGGLNYAVGRMSPATPMLTSISVSPSSASVTANGTQQLTATAKDQFGNALSPQPSLIWTVSGGGTINSSGLFTAGSMAGGPYTVTATSGSLSGTASVTVTAASSFTVGETNILSTNDSGNGNLFVAQQVSLGQTATILSMSFYVTTASGNLLLAIYDATGPSGGPGALKAQTAAFTPKSGWNTQNVVSQVLLPPGTYWLAYLPSSSSLGFKMANTGSAKWYRYTYKALPSTFSSSATSGAYHWSFYATLQ